jgi:hypothetical protein
MKKLTLLLLGPYLLLGGLGTVAAQEMSHDTMSPPKVLTITREFVKPGKGGMTHEKAESAFVQAFAHAKWPTHYLAVDSLSGKSRALFLSGYDSFEAWEKDVQAVAKNATLSAALDRAAGADGALLDGVDGGAFAYREEYSLRSQSDIPHMRYFEIAVFHVRPGHEKDWRDLVKMVTTAYEKIPDAHWVTYEAIYGSPGGTFIVFTPMKSAAEIDRAFAQGKQFEAAMGEDGMTKLSELSAAAMESTESNLFAFNPRMSYVSDDWIKADPDYWKPKMASPPATAPKKSEETAPAH